MLTLAKDKRTSPSARAEVYVVLVNLADDLALEHKDAFSLYVSKEIKQFLEKPLEYSVPSIPSIPDGAPIGMECMTTDEF